jgi:hypothetical protein
MMAADNPIVDLPPTDSDCDFCLPTCVGQDEAK